MNPQEKFEKETGIKAYKPEGWSSVYVAWLEQRNDNVVEALVELKSVYLKMANGNHNLSMHENVMGKVNKELKKAGCKQ